jgi:hypothetical protein
LLLLGCDCCRLPRLLLLGRPAEDSVIPHMNDKTTSTRAGGMQDVVQTSWLT